MQAQTDAATPILNGGDDAQTATAGFYSLHWELPESETPPQSEAPEEPQFLVQEARSASFSDPDQIYKGPDLATFLSGRPNGEYFYRVGRLGPDGRTGSWSSVNHVTVRHHSLGKAFSFLAVGAIVFLATIYVIVRGDRDTRTEGEEE